MRVTNAPRSNRIEVDQGRWAMIGQGPAPDPRESRNDTATRPGRQAIGVLGPLQRLPSQPRCAAAGSLEKALARPCAAPIKRAQAGTKEGRSPAEQRKRKRESLLMKMALDDSPHRSLWAFVSPTPSPAPEADPLPKDGWR